MTLFAFASSHGSPGVTTAVVGLATAWRTTTGREVLVFESDPDGGVLATRFEELRADRTLADVVVDVRRAFDIEAVLTSARPVWGGVPVIVAPPSPEQTYSALSTGGDRLAAGLATDGIDVLVDVGRLTARSPALHLARRAAVTIFVTRPTFEAAASLAARLPELTAHGCDPALVTVGDQPYAPVEIERATAVPLLGVLPHDPRAAAMFAGGAGSERLLRRSLLWRSLCDLSSRLAARVPAPSEAPSHASAQPGIATTVSVTQANRTGADA